MSDVCSLVCRKKHSFDMARSGYMNLLSSPMRAKYPKELFQARHRVIRAGFYAPLIKILASIVSSRVMNPAPTKSALLDAGCGEGSHLHLLRSMLSKRDRFTMIGADIAKEGIHIASASGEDIIWTVADLTRLPFRDKTMDFILNILSPANYPEFERLLDKDGVVIKVIPGKEYLIELRQALSPQKEYSSDQVADYFSDRLLATDTREIRYVFPADESLLPDILAMTPLTWGVDAAKSAAMPPIPTVTVDLKIMVGKKKHAGGQ